MSKAQVGIQLYSVRDRSANDFLGTIREIAEIGYTSVEFAGTFGYSVREVRDVMESVGIKAPSAHVGLRANDRDSMWDQFKESIAYYKELGTSYLVVPSYPLGETPDLAKVQQMAEDLEQAGRLVKEAGMEFGFHNHAVEFKTVEGLGGKLIMDYVLEQVPADLLFAEFDLGWIKVGGQDPAAYVAKYADRVPLVHAKDFTADGEDTEVGSGAVDWDAALAACEAAGVKHIIIEQEGYAVSSLQSAKNNLAWFKARGWV